MPDSIDPSTLRTAALVGIGVIVLLAFLVLRMVKKMVFRVIFLGALAGVGVYLWSQRAELEDCKATCACSFAGFDVDVPGCPDPE